MCRLLLMEPTFCVMGLVILRDVGLAQGASKRIYYQGYTVLFLGRLAQCATPYQIMDVVALSMFSEISFVCLWSWYLSHWHLAFFALQSRIIGMDWNALVSERGIRW